MAAGWVPIIDHEMREEWEAYSVANQGWIENSAYLKAVHPVHRDALHNTIQDHEHDRRKLQEDEGISPFIYRYENGQKVRQESQPGQQLAPLWQISPADYGVVNVDLFSDPRIRETYEKMLKAEAIIKGESLAPKAVLSADTEIGDIVSG